MSIIQLYIVFTIFLFVNYQGEDAENINESIDLSLDKWLVKICDRSKDSDEKRSQFEVDSSALDLIDQYYKLDPGFQQFEKSIRDESGGFLHPYLKGIPYDMDGDQVDEIVCFIGSIYSSPSLIVFGKNQKGNYKKLYSEELWLHNEYPSFKILEDKDGITRLIRTGSFLHRGSGHWLYVYYYYRKIGAKIFKVLETPYRVNDHMDFDLLNTRADLWRDTLMENGQMHLHYHYESTVGYTLTRLTEEISEEKAKSYFYKDPGLRIDLHWNDEHKFYRENNSSLVRVLLNIKNDTLQWKEVLKKKKASTDNFSVPMKILGKYLE